MESRSRSVSLVGASFQGALVTSALLLFVPLGATATTTSVSDGEPVRDARVDRHSLVEREGAGVAVILAVPVAVAAIPLLVRRGNTGHGARMLAAAVLCVGVFVAGFGVGLFYLPSAVLMVIAAFRGTPARAATRTPPLERSFAA